MQDINWCHLILFSCFLFFYFFFFFFTGNLPGVKMLLEAGCDPNLSDKYGKTPLHVLAQEYYAHGTLDNVAILDLLLSREQPSFVTEFH